MLLKRVMVRCVQHTLNMRGFVCVIEQSVLKL